MGCAIDQYLDRVSSEERGAAIGGDVKAGALVTGYLAGAYAGLVIGERGDWTRW